MDNIKEQIVKLVSSKTYGKQSVDQIALSLNVADTDFKTYIKSINELEDEGTIYITGKGFVFLASKLGIYHGIVKKLKKYCGIIELSDGTSITIENEDLDNAYLNDTVLVHTNDLSKGEVMKVLNHAMWECIATYINHSFVPDDEAFPFELKVRKETDKFHLAEGNVVLLRIDSYDDFILNCHIKKILGHKNDPGMDILKSIINADVPYKFDQKVMNDVDRAINEVNKNLEDIKAKRKDFTNEMVVTIDGLDAKDLDDAISLKYSDNGNYLLGVHIADVSSFVTKDSILDKSAFTRGTSIYLADRVIPMLPFSLCNGLCSLNENEERLTMSCIMEIDEEGNVVDYEITPSFIKSSKRLDYEDVNKLFNNEETRLSYPKEMKQMLFTMLHLSGILSKKMLNEGYISLDVSEAKLIMDEERGKVLKIEKRVQGKAEKLIENFMILANEVVAGHIYYMQLPFIYRVHPPISNEKFLGLTGSLKEIDGSLNVKQNYATVKQIQTILEKSKGKDNEYVINNLVLRSMSKAYYSTDNIGHFGLGSKCYTHFTSPIRRYPDLIVHRFLKKYLVDEDFSDETEFLIQAAENSSVTERKAISLEREVEDMKKAEYMQNYVGNIYDGIVTGVLDFGVFVELNNTCEGLMRFETIPNYYAFDYDGLKDLFRVGSKVVVKLISCNVESGEINFAYVKSSLLKREKKNEKAYRK